MKRQLSLGLILLGLFAFGALCATTLGSGQITDFTLSDLPDDDGSGIVLKWKPLPKEYRVIKYNIYRGVSPDSLFLLTYLESDPKLGVLAPYLYYYDTGDQPLIEFENSPMKLRKEKNQPEDSPLYQGFPIDSKLLGSVMDRYNVMALTKASHLHKHSKRITLGEEDFAGLKITQMDGVYAFPKEGVTYYYSIAAVDEKGVVYPASEVKSFAPVDNAPDATAIANVAFINGDAGRVNFEWMPPVVASDIYLWQGWLLKKSALEGGSLPLNWMGMAVPVFELPNMVSGAVRYHSEEFDASTYPPEDYVAILSYTDYSGQSAAVIAEHYRHLDEAQLPSLPDYKVMDKANDKGDCMLISFGKPLAFITQAEYTSKQHKKIRLNYELSENENYKVDKIRFEFMTEDGSPVTTAIENYVDKIIFVSLPKQFHNIRHLHAEISVKFLGKKEFEKVKVNQEIVYDEKFMRFLPQNAYVKGKNISKLYYDVLTRSKLSSGFSSEMRSIALIRTYDHTIHYEDIIFRPISGFDEASGRFSISERLPIALDLDMGVYFDVPLYRDAFEQEMEERKANIRALEAKLSEDDDEELAMELAMAKAEYEYITNHPAYLEGLTAKNDKAWRKIMLKHRQLAMRSYQYRIVATDGLGGFVISDLAYDEHDDSWFYPISQWFDSTKVLTFFASMLLMVLVVYAIYITKRKEVYIRPIAGLQEIDNAIGRATEMGRPVMFVPGWGSLGDVCTIASLMILAQVAKKTAEYDIRLLNPHCDYMVLPLAQEIVSSSYSEVGRPDAFNQNDIFFISDDQFPFCAGVNGITVRDRVATIFYMGFFNAEALLLTETGNQTGAIQIAATDAVTQIPFFITTCDYTLIGEEFYAASAYLSRDHHMVSMLKAQDYFKLFIVITVVIGALLSTFNFTNFIHAFPLE